MKTNKKNLNDKNSEILYTYYKVTNSVLHSHTMKTLLYKHYNSCREKREKAEHAARERQAAAEKAELEKGDKEKAEHEKPEKQKEKADNKSDKEDYDKDLHKKRKSKSKIVRKTKLERQVSSDEHVLSRYELGRTLGDGNFAIVRQAKLKNSNSEYAMKVIDKHKLKGKEHMVENEIEIMKDCHQPNIVKLYEEYETHDKIYLVMELVKVS